MALSQFAPGGSIGNGYMSNLNTNTNIQQPTQSATQPTAQTQPMAQSQQNVGTNYAQGYTGYGNSSIANGYGGGNGGGGGSSSTPPTIQGAVPVGMYTNQASQLRPGTNGAVDFINRFNASHQLVNLDPSMFNEARKNNSEVAFQMLQQGGQQFRNAVMAANGWNQNQMNQWVNQVAYENPRAFARGAGDASTFMKFGAQLAQPTHYGSQGYAQGFTGPQVNDPGLGFTDYQASPTYTGRPRPPVMPNLGLEINQNKPVAPPPPARSAYNNGAVRTGNLLNRPVAPPLLVNRS